MSKTKSVAKNMNASIKPLAGYVLVEPKEREQTTASGIVLPDIAEGEKPQEAKVVAVGDSIFEHGKEIKSPVNKGDTVIFKKWGGNEIKIDDKELLLLKFEDLMAVLE